MEKIIKKSIAFNEKQSNIYIKTIFEYGKAKKDIDLG